MRIYFDFADWWVGYYRGDTHHYVCLIPTLVIRWPRTFKCTCGDAFAANQWWHFPDCPRARFDSTVANPAHTEADGDDGLGFCGFCGGSGHTALNCTALDRYKPR